MQREKHFDAVIIGAGIAGLTCAYCLSRNGLRVLLADRRADPGGVIRSQRVDGYLLELGPNTLSTSRPILLNLIKELGLDQQLQSRPMNDHVRYIWRNSRLSAFPGSLSDFIDTDLLSLSEKVAITRGLIIHRPCVGEDVTVGEYFRRRIGDGAVEALLKPAVAGIYAADVDRISLSATFPRVAEGARTQNRLIGVLKSLRRSEAVTRSHRMVASFDDGLQTLPNALANAVLAHGGNVVMETETRIMPRATYDGINWNVMLSDGRVAVSDHVIVATSAEASANILKPISEKAARSFASIESASLTIIHAGAREDQFRIQGNGFGFLTASNQGVRALGMLWNDRLFKGRAPQNHRLLTCFYGGALDADASQMSDEELRATVLADFKQAMGFSGSMSLCHITRWKSAIPQFRTGHCQLVKNALADLPKGLFVLGNYTGDPSIPGRIEAATDLAEKIFKLCIPSLPRHK